MGIDIESELTRLRQCSVSELLEIYRQVFAEPSRSRHRQHLMRRIAWGLQAGTSKPLSERALRRVGELVDASDLRVGTATKSPTKPPGPGPTLIPGTVISRMYKGKLLEVRVLEDGFEFGGQGFSSLSAVAKHITGAHWNGRLFFRVHTPSRNRRRRG